MLSRSREMSLLLRSAPCNRYDLSGAHLERLETASREGKEGNEFFDSRYSHLSSKNRIYFVYKRERLKKKPAVSRYVHAIKRVATN